MTQDEIRKLLGGYATDTLTADERRLLFEAALEDQELFNALQNEDALKELLADPVTRDRLRAVLSAKPRAVAWKRWMFGVAVPAIVAVIVVVLMNRANAPKLVAMKEVAKEAAAEKAVGRPPAPPAPTPPPPAPEVKKKAALTARAISGAKPVAPAPAPPPAAEAAGRLEPRSLATPAMANFRAGAPPLVVPEVVRQQLSAGLVATAPLYQGPLVRYSLTRSGPNDGAVQVEVTTEIAGYVALYEMDAAGNSKRIYPTGEEAARVPRDATIRIPADPIAVAEGSRLRLVLVPARLQAVNGFLAGADTGVVGGAAPPTPLVVDIPVAP